MDEWMDDRYTDTHTWRSLHSIASTYFGISGLYIYSWPAEVLRNCTMLRCQVAWFIKDERNKFVPWKHRLVGQIKQTHLRSQWRSQSGAQRNALSQNAGAQVTFVHVISKWDQNVVTSRLNSAALGSGRSSKIPWLFPNCDDSFTFICHGPGAVPISPTWVDHRAMMTQSSHHISALSHWYHAGRHFLNEASGVLFTLLVLCLHWSSLKSSISPHLAS